MATLRPTSRKTDRDGMTRSNSMSSSVKVFATASAKKRVVGVTMAKFPLQIFEVVAVATAWHGASEPVMQIDDTREHSGGRALAAMVRRDRPAEGWAVAVACCLLASFTVYSTSVRKTNSASHAAPQGSMMIFSRARWRRR